MKNNLVVRVDPRDYLLGSNSPIQLKANIPNGDWTQYFHFKELQKIGGFESDDCVIFSAQESFDAYFDYLISTNQIPLSVLAQLDAMGYRDAVNSDDKLPHFHTSPRFWGTLTGNGQNGNALQDPWNVARQFGALPWADLPFDASIMTPEQYFAPISAQAKAKAIQFLNLIGGKAAIQYHFVFNNLNGGASFQLMDLSRQTAPLCIGINVGENWNTPEPAVPAVGSAPGHSVTNFAPANNGESILDHYLPFDKILVNGYPIPQVLQAVITPLILPPAPAPLPPNATPAQEQVTLSWAAQVLQAILKWLQK